MMVFFIFLLEKGFQRQERKNLNYYVISYDVFKIAFNLKGKGWKKEAFNKCGYLGKCFK